jgi:hypothetical protein
MIERSAINELKVIWKEAVLDQSKYSPSLCLEKLRRITRNHNHHNHCPGQDSNQAPPKCNSRVLALLNSLGGVNKF